MIPGVGRYSTLFTPEPGHSSTLFSTFKYSPADQLLSRVAQPNALANDEA
jgi:hypothetical protein